MKNIIKILLSIIVLYIITIFFFPKIGESIDTSLGIKINSSISQKLNTFIKEINEIKISLQNWIDNPMPKEKERIIEYKESVEEAK